MEVHVGAADQMRHTAPLFRVVLVPHDLSERAAVAVAVAADLARSHRGRVIVLHVVRPSSSMLDYPEAAAPDGRGGDLVARVGRYLERRVMRALARPQPALECRVMTGDPASCILEAARAADVIVMPTLGRSVQVAVLIGSVAEQVIRGAPVPVLTIGPATIRRGAAAARAHARPVAFATGQE